ncbi:hypothetical protein BU23DRAFT_566316 [Bimuria novae-zelandiae CBS 107.79]|uniref:Uncharacterized protein n=1 Tax=Bimuria novae-zelandiae CBS 107.79 TaxID=1447943 RepID=A0A6A5VER7_9PLEO|nr:hypothetical protein BU23DRAFT_566316 [Bimuria novae-zelandiae CBS 107.79]
MQLTAIIVAFTFAAKATARAGCGIHGGLCQRSVGSVGFTAKAPDIRSMCRRTSLDVTRDLLLGSPHVNMMLRTSGTAGQTSATFIKIISDSNTTKCPYCSNGWIESIAMPLASVGPILHYAPPRGPHYNFKL